MEQQIQKLGGLATSLSPSNEETIKRIKSGSVKYVFSHPEALLGNRELNETLKSVRLGGRNIYLIIDEAHCIIEWGDEFRPDFKNLATLRALFKCQVLALSATITSSGQKYIKENLLMTMCEVVCASPAKENITLIVVRRPSPNARGNTATSPYDFIFEPILNELNKTLQSFPITIIYCKSLQWIGYGYERAREILGENFYAGSQAPENVRVVMFHSSMEKSPGKVSLLTEKNQVVILQKNP